MNFPIAVKMTADISRTLLLFEIENEVMDFVCQETDDTGHSLLKIRAILEQKSSDLFFQEEATRVWDGASIDPGRCYLCVHECQLLAFLLLL